MDLSQIRELLKIIAESGVAEVEIEEDDFKLVVRRTPTQVSLHTPQSFQLPPQPAQSPYQASQPVIVPPPASPAPSPPLPPASPSEATPPEPLAPTHDEHVIKAPIVGTFYSAPAPDAQPFVSIGDQVSEGDTLCIIEAMKLMNEIESEVSGTIKKILIKNSEPVEYDQPLFIIQKS